jgi:hypothetical protein
MQEMFNMSCVRRPKTKVREWSSSVAAGAKRAVGLCRRGLQNTLQTLGVKSAYMSIFGLGADIDTSDKGLEEAFASVDANGNGLISRSEMSKYITKVCGDAKAKDGEVSVSLHMMKAADLDGDGAVSLGEFKRIMRLAAGVCPECHSKLTEGQTACMNCGYSYE